MQLRSMCMEKKGVDIIVYVDDCCIFANEKHKTDKVMKALDGEFDITDKGETINEYLGVKVDHNEDESFRMYQPHLLSRIIKAIPEIEKANPHTTPANLTVQLNKDIDGQERKESWNYRSIIGMLQFLVKLTHPELAHSVHQCTRFCETPKASQKRAVKHILRYLLITQPSEGKEPPKYGLNMKPNMNKSLEVYVNTSFAGNWSNCWSEEPISVLSTTGHVIKYANCPLVRASKLKSKILLSTTESEYIALL
eukprot:1947081-Ditylum_brightwellii.AAC.2